ncbi:HCP-like protein [Trametes cingulata]|nr:HCP-like protein [Trametes cingulata]
MPSPSLSPSTLQAQTPTGVQPPRVTSQISVYSNYSYYELPPTPPANAQPPSPGLPPPTTPSTPAGPPVSPNPGGRPRTKSSAGHSAKAEPVNLTDPKTPQDYLQIGIQHHLENRLAESAAAFEKAATLDGGCGVGMLMWGLAQRHGWGCAQSEAAGFRWLRRAAELAVSDLEKGRQGMDMGAVRSELVLAIYEVGQSFYRGWGVEKDKEMAVQYFRVAARLGDPDAQQELAFCLLNGKGCKKDKREAAKWYRAAVAQGASDIGLAWIYKDKYQ